MCSVLCLTTGSGTYNLLWSLYFDKLNNKLISVTLQIHMFYIKYNQPIHSDVFLCGSIEQHVQS